MFRAYPLAASALVVSALAGCSGKAPPPDKPVTVADARAATAPFAPTLTALGTVSTAQSVAVRSRVDGVIAEVAVPEGASVRAGQVLFRLDDRAARAATALQSAALARDRAQAAEADVELQRAQALVERGFVSKATLDQKRAAAQAARATLGVDRAALSGAGTNLDYLTVRAPISGRLGEFGYRLGASVKANDTTALVTVNQMSPIDVRFAAPPDSIAPLRAALAANVPVTVRPHGVAGAAPATGRLDFLDNNVDPGNGQLAAKARFANADERLWPGSLVDVAVPLGAPSQRVALPEAAVQLGPDGPFVWLAVGGRAAMRPVRIAGRADGRVFLESGVRPGEEIVTDSAKLKPGAKLRVARG